MIGFTIIIPAYANNEDTKTKYHFVEVERGIKRAIESVYSQEYRHFEILVCSDGDNLNVRKIVDDYEDPRIKYYFAECGGLRSRNDMTKIAKGDIIIYLDQDNTIYRNCFFRIREEWDNEVGLLIFRINHQVGIIPVGEKIEHRNIDTLNGAVKKELAQEIKWENKAPSVDSVYYKRLEQICKDEGHKVRFIKDILGVHN